MTDQEMLVSINGKGPFVLRSEYEWSLALAITRSLCNLRTRITDDDIVWRVVKSASADDSSRLAYCVRFGDTGVELWLEPAEPGQDIEYLFPESVLQGLGIGSGS